MSDRIEGVLGDDKLSSKLSMARLTGRSDGRDRGDATYVVSHRTLPPTVLYSTVQPRGAISSLADFDCRARHTAI